jgi:hypothetical protein
LARINFILNELQSNGEVSFKPHGNSMTPRLKSGEPVRVKSIPIGLYKVGDIVYCKIKGGYVLHLLTAISYNKDKDKYQISNNHGFVNGWIGPDNIYGICVEANGKIIVSDEELKNRLDTIERDY